MKRTSQTFSLVLIRAALMLLAFTCAATASAQSEGTPPPFPPPGKLVIATQSGHHVQIEEPELVIKAISDVLATLRK